MGDIAEIEKLVNSAYRGEGSKVGWTTEADLLDGQRTDQGKLREMIQSLTGSIELAFDGDEIFGCIYLEREAVALYFGMLTVRPGLQNRGTGKALLALAEEKAKNLGLTRVRMTVISERKELIEYYQRRGYRRTGKIEPFPDHDQRFGLPKKKLVFEEFEKILNS